MNSTQSVPQPKIDHTILNAQETQTCLECESEYIKHKCVNCTCKIYFAIKFSRRIYFNYKKKYKTKFNKICKTFSKISQFLALSLRITDCIDWVLLNEMVIHWHKMCWLNFPFKSNSIKSYFDCNILSIIDCKIKPSNYTVNN